MILRPNIVINQIYPMFNPIHALRFLFCFLIIIILLCVSPCLSYAQDKSSFNGYVHTPKGDLHILVIFVRYENRSLMSNSGWPDETREGVLPRMADGAINQLFNTDPETIGNEAQIPNLSDYYYKMSGGTFRITADIFPVQVPVSYVPPTINNFFSRQLKMNFDAIKWITENYPDFDWSKYDNRTNNPYFANDNQDTPPDSILDYVVFMHRAQGSTGAGSPGSISIPDSPFKIRDGHTGIQSYADAEHNWLYFKHEFAHNLYRCPHYLGANSADGLRYYTQKGWGLMAAWHAPFFTTNAWEKWWLGWLEPTEITQNGTYTLKDMMEGREAVRIQIPGTQDYLWIENHQKKDTWWDRKMFFNSLSQRQPLSASGIYMYVVASPGSDRKKPDLNPFNTRHANIIKVYNGEGNFDVVPTGDKLFNGFFESTVMEKVAPNPFSGQNDFQFIRYDYDNNGRLDLGLSHGNRDRTGKEQRGVWSEKINNRNVLTFGNTGDGNDAFVPGDEIGLSGKIPVTHFPEYLHTREEFEPYLLNGLSIKILEEDEQGTMKLEVKFDDWEVRTDQRWCGNLRLPAFTNEENKMLIIGEEAKVDLALSGTPDRITRHPETGSMSNPTRLLVESGRGITLKKKSELNIAPSSTLELAGKSSLIVEKGATLYVQGTLRLSDEAELVIEKKGKLILEAESELILGTPRQLVANPKGIVRDRRMP